jgi:phosphoribulokinase
MTLIDNLFLTLAAFGLAGPLLGTRLFPIGTVYDPFIARDIPSADESMVVIRFANPKGIDFPYLLSMLDESWMSRPNNIVCPGGKMGLAMQLILTPLILRLMDRKRRA